MQSNEGKTRYTGFPRLIFSKPGQYNTGLPVHNLTYDEKELLARIANGDEEAFYNFYSHYAPRLRTYIRQFTHSPNDAEELIQETFMRVWLARDKLPEVQHIQAWLFRVAARNCLNFLRKRHNEAKKITQASGLKDPEELQEDAAELIQMKEIKLIVHRAVMDLNDTRKRIYRMSREHGLTATEIASQLNMPIGTVKNNLTAALKEIRHYLSNAGYCSPVVLLIFLQIL